METAKLEYYWDEIPVGKENAITYVELINKWGKHERVVRQILHELSLFDNGDNYVLVRSSKGKGFYRTDDVETLQAFKKECLNKGKSVFAPVKKINRVLYANTTQYNVGNNLRVIRENNKLKQSDVCVYMRKFDYCFDVPLLSKFENGVCLPTPFQLQKLAELYDCEPLELVNTDMLY